MRTTTVDANMTMATQYFQRQILDGLKGNFDKLMWTPGPATFAKIDNICSPSSLDDVQHNDQTQEVPLTDSTKDVLVDKFKVTRHKKPYPTFTGEHFVLTPANDVAARVALEAYANAIEKKFPKKALGIRRWLEDVRNAEDDARMAGQAEAVSKLRASKKLA